MSNRERDSRPGRAETRFHKGHAWTTAASRFGPSPCNENDRQDEGSCLKNHPKVLRDPAACPRRAYGRTALIPLESKQIHLNAPASAARRGGIALSPAKQTTTMRSRSNSFKVCAALLAGARSAGALVAPNQPRPHVKAARTGDASGSPAGASRRQVGRRARDDRRRALRAEILYI